MEGPALTHLDAAGQARMVDVSGKEPTTRWARARAVVRMSPEAASRVVSGDTPKGDVLGVARIAAIQAAKRTDELIPLCHQLPLTQVDPQIAVATLLPYIRLGTGGTDAAPLVRQVMARYFSGG